MAGHEGHLARIRRTPGEIAALIEGRSDEALGRRPAEQAWAPKEVVCHLRDTEESFGTRIHLALENETPRFPPPVDADRWAADRQYLRNDAAHALAAFARRRAETVALLEGLSAEQWERAGIHATRGRMTVGDVLAFVARHDDNHLAQLERALRGEP